ncbi:DUF4097 family beta strand repeat-containing protein [Frankia sp. ACN1ag]|uniref:DUF4097 family beta strand repeat-containing protein n=1 Tax=Frankia sp. ACN1ag TaxID=102891 RepID=UPI0006DCC322|nr:DUF4097 family beta strand repeat-containing protein [Frankia sp. ACN1ag]KQC35844.1 hypothetical protein UK82_24090 [Frankia sp. ACN1ag]
MPSFATPEPILAVVELGVGSLRIRASDRADTVVEVRPAEPASDADVQAARETAVEYSAGRLTIRAPRRRLRSLFGTGEAVEVTVDLPTGSRLDASAGTGVQATGRLGDCTVQVARGGVDLDEVADLRLRTANGDVVVGRCRGRADVGTANGAVRIQQLDGPVLVQTASGAITLGEAADDVRLATAAGVISVDRALAGVDARTGSADVRLGEVVRGTVALVTGSGRLDIGVREGTAALLDLRSGDGTVRSEIAAVDRPAPTDETVETVEIRALSGRGNILVHRSRPARSSMLTK